MGAARKCFAGGPLCHTSKESCILNIPSNIFTYPYGAAATHYLKKRRKCLCFFTKSPKMFHKWQNIKKSYNEYQKSLYKLLEKLLDSAHGLYL